MLACIDSRTAPNIICNQPISSLFVSRVAGNPVTPYVLGGMENIETGKVNFFNMQGQPI